MVADSVEVPVTRQSRVVYRRAAAACLGFALAGGAAWSQAVPADLQAAILARTLAYDRALKAHAGAAVVVGVLARQADKASLDTQGRLVRALLALEPPTVQGLPLKAVAVTFKDRATLDAWIQQEGVDALYVTAGLAAELDVIRSLCEERRVATLGATRAFVEKGLALAVVAKGDTPRLLVNLKSAEAAGMSLDPKLLQLSEVIR